MSNAKPRIEIDTHQLQDMFADLTGKEFKRAERTALRKSAQVLAREARKQLKRRVKSINTDHVTKKGRHYKLSRGIGVSVAKDAKSAKVNIMKDFRLKFFELGTQERFATKWKGRPLKKKASRGRISKDKFQFFKPAQEASRDKVFNEMGTRVAEAVKKINDKKRS